MGLFDQVLNERSTASTDFSPAEAFAAIALVAIASDGHFSEEEIDLINTSLRRMQLFKSYPVDVLRRMYDKLFGILRRNGINSLLDTAKSALPYDLREPAFAIATDLILSDGTVTTEEEAFLNQLCQSLEINSATALKTVEVMLIKNRG
ncbi:MAG: tellurite resistance TerB family protein [Kovacikia sp.]